MHVLFTMNQRLYTLVFLRRNTEVLMGYKTRGLGKDYWNGFGGKIERDETPIEGAVRELKEESNLEAVLKQIGVVVYAQESKACLDIVHVFTADKFTGELQESEEMSPIKWFDLHDMPYEHMWPEAKTYLPLLLENWYFKVHVTYGSNDCITSVNKRVVNDLKQFDKLLMNVHEID